MNNAKKVLLVHRYYYPDTSAYATMLHKIALALRSDGIDVDVYTSKPSYYGSTKRGVGSKETCGGIRIQRASLLPEPKRNMVVRALNAFLFCVKVFFVVLFRRRYDFVMVATTPPLLISSAVRIACWLRKQPYIYHCQDIYPEIALASGSLRENLWYKLLLRIDRKTCEAARSIVVLSEDMKQTIARRGVEGEKIQIINNFIWWENTRRNKFDLERFGIQESSYKFVYCGNLGRLQKLDLIMDAILAIASTETDIQFIFVGEGVLKSELEIRAERHKDRIIFTGYLPPDEVAGLLRQCDLGLVPIEKGVHRAAYPSKIITNIYCGLKTLTLVEEESELGRFIMSNDLGQIVSNFTVEEVITAIRIAEWEGKDGKAEKDRITGTAIRTFGEQKTLDRWVSLYKSL